MRENSLKVLEYYRLLDIVSSYAASPLGRSNCLSLKPLQKLESIESEQRLVSEMKELVCTKGFVPLSSLFDLRPMLRKASKKGAFLEAKNFLSIHNLIGISHQVKSWIRGTRDLYPSLWDVAKNIPACDILAKEIAKSITEDGKISDRASPLLSSLRSQRVSQRMVIEKRLNEILSSLASSDDNIISVRDGRYVISIKTAKKNVIKGIVHGYSSTHSTCFIEPVAVVEENNYLVELTDREKEEEKKVLKRLTGFVSDFSYELVSCLEIMERFDGLFARAEFSRAIKAIRPILSTDKMIYLSDALNPILLSLYLESSKGNKEGSLEPVVPIDIKIDSKKNILIISGPNRGGKTVALKTIGLLTLMTQSGMHIPAKEGSTVSVFNNILAEIGDDQDISAGLSTFSARLEHLKEIIDRADRNSLVILDELGTGTDPDEGASLAMAMLDYFSQKGSLSAISTHYQRLKRYGLINKKAQNASVEFDKEKGQPTFKLLSGMPGVSHAIEIAQDLGIRDEIIDRATMYLGKERGRPDSVMEDLVKMMEEVKSEKEDLTLAKEKYELSKNMLEEEREKLIAQLNEMLVEKKHKAENLLAEAKRNFGEAIEHLKKKGAQGQSEATQQYTNAKHNLMDAISGITLEYNSANHVPLSVGQKVFHKKSGKRGWVVGIDEGPSRAQIMIGNVKLKVDSSELIPEPDLPTKKEGDTIRGKQWSVSSPIITKKELNLIGYTIAEALPLVDKIIDQAMVHGYSEVKIVHGMGSGVLKKAVREHLKGNCYVKDFIPGGRDGGNDGITLVEL
ncbi:MAG: endonuclease MutS2 [Deltaproteobacteria bacterium]|nr:endonuclease MutS2 [Deltaproteobacteria bacterium]